MLKIEKTIHQVWGGAPMPYRLKILTETWKRYNPGWSYKLWTQHDMDSLVESNFPGLQDFYHALPFDIQRWDMIRYLILYAEGGMYVDADIECFKPIAPLLDEMELFYGLEPPEHICIVNGRKQRAVCNAFMGAVKGHPVWEFITVSLLKGQVGFAAGTVFILFIRFVRRLMAGEYIMCSGHDNSCKHYKDC